jgi:hypothetical protein
MGAGQSMGNDPTEHRLTVNLPVRIWGMSAEGRPFSQHAHAYNISAQGALISGVDNELKVGDVIGVQCEDKKTRCTVIWVLNTGPVKKNEVGVKLVADQDCPWKAYLPKGMAAPAVDASNRRRFYRHKISLPLEIRDERVNLPMRINATDVSGNGCYIESMQPLTLGTVLRVDFWVGSDHINISAVVRTCDPGVGNGIEFTGMPVETKARLQSYLDSIDPQIGMSASKPG